MRTSRSRHGKPRAVSSGGLSSGSRTTPDVAWDANPSTGVSVYDSVPYYGQSGGWFTVGGTSVGAPSWAGLIAIADQGLAHNGVGSLSNAQASLYQLSSPTSITRPAARVDLHLVRDIRPGDGAGQSQGQSPGPALVQLNTPASTPTATSTAVAVKASASGRGGSLRSPSSISDEPDDHRDREQLRPRHPARSDVDHGLEPDLDLDPDHGELTPVFIVPAPLPPIVIHLGAASRR